MMKARPWFTYWASGNDTDVNDHAPWSEWAVKDLIACAQHGTSLRETARFLRRTEMEVRTKAKELGLKFCGRL